MILMQIFLGYLLILYILLELLNYITHINTLNSLQNRRGEVQECSLRHKVKHIQTLCKYDPDPVKSIEDIYYGEVEWSKIPRDDLKTTLTLIINNFRKNNVLPKDGELVEKALQSLESKTQRSLSYKPSKNIKRINLRERKLRGWYKPIILRGFIYVIRKFYDYKLHKAGFKRVQQSNGLVLWYKESDKQNASIFFHCSIAGAIPYIKFLKNIRGTVIIPEVPGISWQNYTNTPPSLNQIVTDTVEFTKSLGIDKFNIVAHSFGCFLGCRLINNYQQHVNKAVLIEGFVYPVRMMKAYWYIHIPIYSMHKLSLCELLLVPFFIRDTHCQFYINREVSISDGMLNRYTRIESRKDSITVILSEYDNKIDCKRVMQYVKNSGIEYDHIVVPGKGHGSFITNDDIQDKVIGIIS